MKAQPQSIRYARRIVFVTTLAIASLTVGFAHAITMQVVHSAAGGTYPSAGGTADITVDLSTSGAGTVLSLGLFENVPAGWSFNSVVSGPLPIIQPSPGATGTLEFAWSTVPAFPMTFVYRLNVPAGGTRTKVVSGKASFVDGLGQGRDSFVSSVSIESDTPVDMPLRTWPAGVALALAGLASIRFTVKASSKQN